MNKGIPQIQTKLDKDNLSAIWLEEGDGTALLLNGEIISIIPSWVGQNYFYGYTVAAKGENYFAWELSRSNEINKRVEKAKEF